MEGKVDPFRFFFIGEGANVTSFVVNNIPISRPKSVACLDMWFRTLANTCLLPRGGFQQLFQFMKSHCLLLPPASKSYLDIGNNPPKYEIFEAFWNSLAIAREWLILGCKECSWLDSWLMIGGFPTIIGSLWAHWQSNRPFGFICVSRYMWTFPNLSPKVTIIMIYRRQSHYRGDINCVQ